MDSLFKRSLIDGQVCDMLSYAFRVVMSLIQKRDYRWYLNKLDIEVHFQISGASFSKPSSVCTEAYRLQIMSRLNLF